MIDFFKWLFKTDEKALEQYLDDRMPGQNIKVHGRITTGLDITFESLVKHKEVDRKIIHNLTLNWLLDHDYPARPRHFRFRE